MITSQNNPTTIIGLLRIALGSIFLWAYIDKVFGLGFATTIDQAWLTGNSPTLGFLKFATSGPLSTVYHRLAGNALVDWLFMLGLLGIGLALVLGVGMKIAAYSGTILMLLMWAAVLPPKNNPVLDEHIIYILVLQLLYRLEAGNNLGFGKWWKTTTLGKYL